MDRWLQELEWTSRLMEDLQMACDGVPAPDMPFEDQEVNTLVVKLEESHLARTLVHEFCDATSNKRVRVASGSTGY